MAEEEGVHHVFVYGNLRPDANKSSVRFKSSRRAWLMGSRLYNLKGNRAAVSLEEPGNAVKGYVVSAGGDPAEFSNLLVTCERAEHQGFDRDLVQVVTESGERVAAYVYHCPLIDRTNPVRNGDWLSC